MPLIKHSSFPGAIGPLRHPLSLPLILAPNARLSQIEHQWLEYLLYLAMEYLTISLLFQVFTYIQFTFWLGGQPQQCPVPALQESLLSHTIPWRSSHDHSHMFLGTLQLGSTVSILQMEKLRLREQLGSSQVHKIGKCWMRDSHIGHLFHFLTSTLDSYRRLWGS